MIFCQILSKCVFFSGADIPAGCYGSAEGVEPKSGLVFKTNKMRELEMQGFPIISAVTNADEVAPQWVKS